MLAGPQLFQPCFTGVMPVKRAVIGAEGSDTFWLTAAGATAACVGTRSDVAVISIVGGTVAVDSVVGIGDEVITAVTKDCRAGVDVAGTTTAAGDSTVGTIVAVTGALTEALAGAPRSKLVCSKSSAEISL